MSNTISYGEPWRQDYLRGRNGFIINAKDDAVTGMNGWQRDEDFFRAIQCVNVCAGIAEPAAALKSAQETLAGIANAKPNEWDDPSDFEAWAKSRARFALAQLNPAKS